MTIGFYHIELLGGGLFGLLGDFPFGLCLFLEVLGLVTFLTEAACVEYPIGVLALCS